MHRKMLSDESSVLIDETSLTIDVNNRLSGLCTLTSGEEIALHCEDGLLLGGFHLCKGFVDIVLNPGKILLSWVS